MHPDFYTGELLLVNKPYTWTSFQAVNKLKHGFKKHPSMLLDGKFVHLKIGHAGTLDPLATGLLIVCTGKKTKQLESYQAMPKEYTGTIMLGATTPCYDLEKEVDAVYPTAHITNDMVMEAAKSFVGEQLQTPPIFSAVMVNGERAYDLARAGKDVELKSRPITIYEFGVAACDLPQVHFRIVCSKGTYIRSIARDFGLTLGSGAHLTALCRTKIGDYSIGQAHTPEEIIASNPF